MPAAGEGLWGYTVCGINQLKGRKGIGALCLWIGWSVRGLYQAGSGGPGLTGAGNYVMCDIVILMQP